MLSMDNAGHQAFLLPDKNKLEMPYKSDKIPIAGTKYDKRAKLNKDERNAIIILTEKGYSQRKLAAMFGVSRRLVQHIINPQPRCPAKPKTAEYWAEAKRAYRRRKHELYKTGKIQFKKQSAKKAASSKRTT